MADKTFVSKVTPIPTAWLQDLNDLFYKGTKPLTLTGLTVNGNASITGTLGVTGALTSGAIAAAAITASGLVTANLGLTVASGKTLTLTGATVTGTPTWSSSQAITLSTAAQPNITSVGTLTSLTLGGAIGVSAGSLTITPSLVVQGTTIQVGTSPALTGSVAIPYNTTITSRNNA